MRIGWENVPTWPLYVALYVAMGIVVPQSLRIELRRQCEVASGLTTRQTVVAGVFWPVTATAMMFGHADPMAALQRRKL